MFCFSLSKSSINVIIKVITDEVVNRVTGKNNKIQPDTIGSFGVGLIVVSFLFVLFVSNVYVLGIALGLIIIGILCVIYHYIAVKKERADGIEKRNKNLQDFQSEYNAYFNKLAVMKSGVQVTLLAETEKIPHHIWIADSKINMFPVREYYEMRISAVKRPSVTELKFRSIPIEDIWYFEEFGELRKYASVSGGGISLRGAMLGKLIAGDVGMILGGREPIKTDIISEDDRIVELIYKNSEEVENMEFTHDAYAVLKRLIPDKELRRIRNLQQTNKV